VKDAVTNFGIINTAVNQHVTEKAMIVANESICRVYWMVGADKKGILKAGMAISKAKIPTPWYRLSAIPLKFTPLDCQNSKSFCLSP